MKYTIFETKWGYFGLAGTRNGLYYTHLPITEDRELKSHLLKNNPTAQYKKKLFYPVQKQIKAYFRGGYVNFKPDIHIVLDGQTDFTIIVLNACRKITFGQTRSYGQLAKTAGRSKAARAVGTALGKNPLPLIIPCHRVIYSNGGAGGFSAFGGVKLKERMLALERQTLDSK